MDGSFDVKFMMRYFVPLNGSIALISIYSWTSTFCISILSKVGVRESWINLFIVDPFHEHLQCSGSLFPFVELPVEHGKNDIVLLHKRDQKLVWVDLRIYMIKYGFKGDIFSCHIGKYKKNFLPIGGINN
jgi:hypothetical protein